RQRPRSLNRHCRRFAALGKALSGRCLPRACRPPDPAARRARCRAQGKPAGGSAGGNRGARRLKTARMRIAAAVILCGLSAAALLQAASAYGWEETALDRYIAALDLNYHYQLLNTFVADTHTAYLLEVTSQQWRTAEEVDRPIWKHWLTIVRPEQVATTTSPLIISGGSNEKPPPQQIDPVLTQIALATNSVVSEIRMVPNQPLVFAGDGSKRTEDAITAYTWERFLTTGDDTWPLRLPMTKSVVRAMDTITSFCASREGGEIGRAHV